MKSTLIITTRNEIQGVKTLLPQIPLSEFDEVLVIDLHSTDGTIEFLKSQGLRIIPQEKAGRGIAARMAGEAATGDVLVWFAPDGNENPADLIRLKTEIVNGADMAIASRFLPGARNEEDDHWFRPRAWANKIFTLAVRLVWGGKISDTINGYRSMRRDKFLALKTDELGFSIEFQMSIRALKLKMKVVEFPTTEGNRIGGHSTAYTIPTGLKVLRCFFREIWLGRRPFYDQKP